MRRLACWHRRRRGGSLAERVEQMMPLVEVHEHGAARYRTAVVFLSAHVVKEVERAVVAEGLDGVLRGLATEHDVRADEERRARAGDLEVGRDDGAVVKKRRRVAERDRAWQERVLGELRELEHEVGDDERRRAHRPKRQHEEACEEELKEMQRQQRVAASRRDDRRKEVPTSDAASTATRGPP